MSRERNRVFDLLYLSHYFFLVILSEIITGLEHGRVVVKEGSDALLPCSLSTKENIEGNVFDWRKDGQKEVFTYDAGIVYNNGRSGQDEQFKGCVSHFEDELKLGNASIIIRNTKVADSGNYTCDFPHLQPSQTFNIELVVGAAAELCVTTLNQTKDWALLQCLVRGAFPKPKVEFQDSSGNMVPAHEPQVLQRGDGAYNITLQAAVNKTDRFRCVVTQEEIHHQIYAETYVFLPPPPENDQTSTNVIIGVSVGVVCLIVGAVAGVLLARCGCCCNKGSTQDERNHTTGTETEQLDSERDENVPLRVREANGCAVDGQKHLMHPNRAESSV